MANQQIKIDMLFNANTAQAKRNIENLANTLHKIQTTPANYDFDGDIQKASKAAMELQQHLSKAFNQDTGNINLSKFATSLKSSGQDLEYFRKNLTAMGGEGIEAFNQLANSIAMADTRSLSLSGKLEKLVTTLKNTARWQLSSSLLTGLTSAVSGAYRYAQDLNRSLNDIRIVTGQSADQMAKFAQEANKAAQQLSTTTNEYAKASLIYYQQGLSDAEVKERTDVTIKMANVSRQSAETVSDQMTAVWNNFADGSKTLEYYADVMTALGAATASSTEEISTGLEKFSAVAETVGLSYEYATAALATVTATTRQSADVVGTALKN